MSGQWLLATAATGRIIPADGPYPHVEGATVTSPRTGRPVRLTRRDCHACIRAETPDLEVVR
ncbi:hypothetical protein [Polymorphospora rubra]|uniref:Uncharacterized protein n=1 Tax=Polymorphospora rubra TaxID=338584 RepID=A0A810MSW0_9ACTN|nr:hypothetical protein [Polymorphospora rubra]BCJ64121.1 hypothetical protein Prubr_11420 [Polymorphospora rubra]